MATLTNGINFTGSIGNISGYTRKGSTKTYARTKGGASKQRIEKAPEFELTRQNYKEFSGCGKAASSIRKAIFPIVHLAAPNFNIISKATIIIKAIQQLDDSSDRGKRSILFSRYGYLLEGFSLNPEQHFDSIVMPPLTYTIERETGTATVQLPALHPGVNLVMPWKYPLFRFVVSFGAIADLAYDTTGYISPTALQLPYAAPAYTAWQFSQQTYAGETVTLQLDNLEFLDETKTLLLSVGLEMGTPITDALIQSEKKKGCGKILKVG